MPVNTAAPQERKRNPDKSLPQHSVAFKKRSTSCISIVTNGDVAPIEHVDAYGGNEIIIPSKEAVGIVACTDDDDEDLVDTTTRAKVGLIFESGEGHFDRSNRLQRERPARIVAVEAALRNAGLFDRCKLYRTVDALLADADLASVHAPAYLKRLDTLSSCTCCTRLDQEADQYNSVFLTSDSYDASRKAASALCTLTDSLLKENDISAGFAVIRPPGHHAEPNLMGGYCILNNVATAVHYARSRYNLQRILIIDWDVHHGNGTQRMFENSADVCYISIHRGRIYPYSGYASEVGTVDGKGFTVNLAWSTKGMGDEEYIAAFQKIVLPIMGEFDPEMIFVSAGFDAARGDLGECCVSPEGFRAMTAMIRHVSPDIPVVCALEGGYIRSMLAKCVVSVVEALMEAPAMPPCPAHVHPQAQLDIENTLRNHRGFWKSLALMS